MNYTEAKKIMGKNFIGPEELSSLSEEINILPVRTAPPVPYDAKTLKKVSRDFVLVLGVSKTALGSPLTLNALRDCFGLDPAKGEPCFYNQDWYVREKFADKTTLKKQWYLIRKHVTQESRGVRPDVIEQKLKKDEEFPTAILTAFTFFAYYLLNKKALLWKHDFIWCSDKDSNGDRIYTGRYADPKKMNKNGFNIHRHLSIRPNYGATIVLHS